MKKHETKRHTHIQYVSNSLHEVESLSCFKKEDGTIHTPECQVSFKFQAKNNIDGSIDIKSPQISLVADERSHSIPCEILEVVTEGLNKDRVASQTFRIDETPQSFVFIDTNTKNNISVTVCIILVIEGGRKVTSHRNLVEFWAKSNSEDAEKRAVVRAIKHIQGKGKELGIRYPVAIYTDHNNHNRIRDINKGKKAIFDRFFLPDEFILNYASSDRNKRTFPNNIFKLCDRYAGKLLAVALEDGVPTDPVKQDIESKLNCDLKNILFNKPYTQLG